MKPMEMSGNVNEATDDVDAELIPSYPPSKSGVTFLLMATATSIVLGSASQYGYQSGVVNAPMDVITSKFANETCDSGAQEAEKTATCRHGENMYAVGVSMLAVGGIFGSIAGGFLADRIGRKMTLLLNNVFGVGGGIMVALSNSYILFIFGRLVLGLNAGIGTAVAPVYLSEVSPIKLRGSFGTLFQLGVVTFIFLSEVLGIPQALGTQKHDLWRLLFGFPILLSCLQLFSLPFLPESPRYLYLKRKDEKKAAEALRRLQGESNVAEGLAEFKAEGEKEASEAKVTFLDLFRDPVLRYLLFVTFGLHLSQQLSGINGVFYYSTKIFKQAGLSSAAAATALVGVIMIVMTLLTLRLIDRVGRRTLMLYGLGLVMIFHMCLTIGFCFQAGFYNGKSDHITAPGIVAVASSLLVVTGFALGPGAIPWLVGPELFTQAPRVRAVTLAVIVNWAGNGIVGYTFPKIFDSLYPYGMILFAGICAVFWLFVYFYMPETKGEAVDEIIRKVKQRIDRHR